MQRIEKYGVIALVFLLVTILAVSLWSQKKGKSPFGWFNKKDAPAEVAKLPETPANRPAQGPPLNPNRAPENGYQPLPEQPTPFMPATGDTLQFGQPPRVAGGNDLGGKALAPGNGTLPTEIDSPANETRPTSFAPAPEKRIVNTPKEATTPAAGTRTYVVKAGETLGEIASRELGSYARWTEIARLNDNLDPKRVRSGMQLALPGDARPAKKTAPVESPAVPMSGGSYVVRAGDTLSAIADRTLGDSGRWTEIARLNPKVNPNRLSVGTRLALPAGGSRDAAEPSGPKTLLAQATARSKVR